MRAKNTNYSYSVFIALVLLLVASCSTVPKQTDLPVSSNIDTLWQQHQAQLKSFHNWSAKGRAALRNANNNWSATLSWEQVARDYHVRLSGPFGRGAVKIDGVGDGVSVHIAGQQAVVADDAETLLNQQLGWTVPVKSLPYWLRGLPAPGDVENLSLNTDGVAEYFEQQGWRIEYSAYRPLRTINLPRKIQIENASLRLKLVLDRWHIDEVAAVSALP